MKHVKKESAQQCIVLSCQATNVSRTTSVHQEATAAERRASPMGAESALPFACKMVSHADHAGVRRLPILELLWAGLRSVYRLQENL